MASSSPSSLSSSWSRPIVPPIFLTVVVSRFVRLVVDRTCGLRRVYRQSRRVTRRLRTGRTSCDGKNVPRRKDSLAAGVPTLDGGFVQIGCAVAVRPGWEVDRWVS